MNILKILFYGFQTEPVVDPWSKYTYVTNIWINTNTLLLFMDIKTRAKQRKNPKVHIPHITLN